MIAWLQLPIHPQRHVLGPFTISNRGNVIPLADNRHDRSLDPIQHATSFLDVKPQLAILCQPNQIELRLQARFWTQNDKGCRLQLVEFHPC